MRTPLLRSRGMTFVDVVVGSALILLVFTGIMAGVRLGVELLGLARAEQGALSIATEEIEYIRSLPYDDVATFGGIPAGSIPQSESVELNGITYTKRVFVQYIDAPEDGSGINDENDIVADYKRVRVGVSWETRGKEYETTLVTNVAPLGIETIVGGGTLQIQVFDALVTPVAGATVRVTNASTSPAIDVTTETGDDGLVFFPGAPTASGYSVVVSKEGYSSAQTYAVSAGNTSPDPGFVTVAEGQTSSLSFAIDRLSSMAIRTQLPVEPATTTDSFDDSSLVADVSDVQVSGGEATLASGDLGYQSSGMLYSTEVTDPLMHAWTSLSWTDDEGAGTSATYRLYYMDTNDVRQLVPDAALSGNAAGFTTSPVDLSAFDAAQYDSLIVGIEFETNNPAVTPSVESWSLAYEVGPTPLPNIDFDLQGAKTIGSVGELTPVYKYQASLATDGNGDYDADELEWDTYELTVPSSTGYDISELCPVQPIVLNPNTDLDVSVTLEPHTTRSLRVVVVDPSGVALPDASVRLSGTGYDETMETSDCGQVFFTNPGVVQYALDTTLAGYIADLRTHTVEGTDVVVVTLSPN